MSFEKQLDINFDDGDKAREGREWVDKMLAENPGKTIGDIVFERACNDSVENKEKKRPMTKKSLELYRMSMGEKKAPAEESLTAEPDKEIDLDDEEKENPGYELYGRFEQFRKSK